jgi:glycosyltransferase involved in cell wall biosynthesis
VERARKAVEGLGGPHQFEAVERWRAASFDAPRFVWRPEACQGTGPNLLYLSSASLYSGAEECLRGLAEGLDELGFRQTAVIGVEGLLTCRLREAGCQVISPNWDFGGSRASQGVPREDEAHRKFAESVLDAVRPTYIHCNSDPGRYFTQGARARGIPIAFHARTCTFTRMEAVLAESTHVISVSEFVKRRLIHSGIPPSKITVVYDGINPGRLSRKHFSRSEMRRRFGLPEDALVILMVARASPQKRHDLMLDAFAELCQGADEARLVFVTDAGPDETLTKARRKVAELALESKVHWLPFQDDIRQIESAADIIALPSDEEALGTCILEGMSLELPVVVSDSGGAHELIEEGISGLSFRGGDAKALARVLCRLVGNPGLRAELGREARRRIEQRFTLRHHAEQVAAVLAKMKAATG